ncbi:MAG: hypothetical protein JXB26_15430 [Candidatus Aminicenantes bacterium]|nr:hypothetical protein [Candidatus Aminicenantes bacterium]
MFKKSVFIGVVILLISNFTGITYGKEETTGYLQVIYKSCECGMTLPHEYSCYVPFHITGNKIIGDYEIEEGSKNYLPVIPMYRSDRDTSDFVKQYIKYSYKCPPVKNCPPPDVSGELIVHKVSGKVIKNKGKKILHFVVRLSIPECTMNVCGYVNDCSMEPWSDEFLAPFKDGYHTNRGKTLFIYVVNLQSGSK